MVNQDAVTVQTRAREAERRVADAMLRAGRLEQQRHRLQLVGVPLERIDGILDALQRIAGGGRPPAVG